MRTTLRLAIAAAAALAPALLAAQSDSLARHPAARTLLLPYLGSAPETGLQYGVTAFRVLQPADAGTRPSTWQLFASYTAKSQAKAFLEMDRWTARNDWRVTTRLEWQRFPLPYHGTGDRSLDAAEEIYTPRGLLASAAVQRRIRGPLYALGALRVQDQDIVETDSAGELRRGAVIGSRGGRVAQLQGGATWDTRDDVFAPRTGMFVQATAALASAAIASDFDFTRIVVDGRRYVPIGERSAVALQLVVEATGGREAPFDQLSLVGGSNYMRGYARGRFRDRHLAAAQAEYRAPITGRLGWAAFAGGGRIAPRVADLAGSDARFLPSYGLGLRWRLFATSRTNIRIDYGRGTAGQGGLYVALNEAF
jgi:hypothetical protein